MELLNERVLDDYIDRRVEAIMAKYRPRVVNQKMFNRQDAAKYLGISKSKLDKEVSKGNIRPSFPFEGKTKYYLREELDRVAEKGNEYRKKAILK